jgi:transcriptional regulator with XRE-family HTH domain
VGDTWQVRAHRHDAPMRAYRLASGVRAIRVKRGLRQADVAAAAGTSQPAISRLERGDIDGLTVRAIERIGAVLDIRVALYPRWRGGDLDRLINAGHAAMHEAIARWFRRRWPGWQTAPEVSFSIWGERGVIDILCWHAESRTLLVIELKTELTDLNEVVGTLDRKRRLAAEVAAERGWDARQVGVWLVVAATRTNRRRVAAHATYLRNAYPADRGAMRRWLARPEAAIAALSLESFGGLGRARTAPKRVRRLSS